MAWFQRHPRAMVAILGILLIAAGSAATGFLNLRNLRRIDTVHERLSDLERLRALRQEVEASLLNDVRDDILPGSFLAEDVHLQVENALDLEGSLDAETASELRRIEALLSRPGNIDQEVLLHALELAGAAYHRETRAQEARLGRVRTDARREFFLGVALLFILALLAGGTAWLLPKRLLDPLANLRVQFEALGSGRFQRVALGGVDSALIPLFQNYNHLVQRLEELEAERKQRAESLEGEVRAGARVLLEQQRALAEAERLAAVGETAAGMAHELRNPLAGILAALENMKKEAETPQIARRLELLREETNRVVQRLNRYLAASRHAPEPSVFTSLGDLVGDLLALLRYQAPPGIQLDVEMEPGIRCRLPEGRIRQALLNLVGNSLHALGQDPGTVTVLAEVHEGFLELEVKDDGPGFPEEILDLAGQPFQTGRESGTGLGLAMVQRVASDLGGTMTVTNLIPRGASVVLKVPCETGGETAGLP